MILAVAAMVTPNWPRKQGCIAPMSSMSCNVSYE